MRLYARLADFHHCANLTQIELLLITKAEQQPLPLRNGFNGLNQSVPQAGLDQLVQRAIVRTGRIVVTTGLSNSEAYRARSEWARSIFRH